MGQRKHSPVRSRDFPAGEEYLLARLPAAYRERPGVLWPLLTSVSGSVFEFRESLRSRESLWNVSGHREPSFPGEFLAFLEGERTGQNGGSPFIQSACTTGALARWIEKKTGVAPLLWPGLSLEVAGAGRLRVSFIDVPRSLVVVWAEEAGGWPEDGRIGSLQDISPESLPVGLRMQIAKLNSDPPVNPYVEGLELAGKLVNPWS